MSGDYTALDTRALDAAQVTELIDRIPLTPEQREQYQSVDGRDVMSHGDLYQPAYGILPERPTDEQKAEMRQTVEARKGMEKSDQVSSCCHKPEVSIEDRKAEMQQVIEERDIRLEEENPTIPCCKYQHQRVVVDSILSERSRKVNGLSKVRILALSRLDRASDENNTTFPRYSHLVSRAFWGPPLSWAECAPPSTVNEMTRPQPRDNMTWFAARATGKDRCPFQR